MSGESKQTYTVEEVKGELRQAVRQLSELSRSDVTFEAFCEQVLTTLVKLTGGHGALLWQSPGPGRPAAISHRAIPPSLTLDIDELRHREAINQVIESKKPVCIDSTTLRNSDSDPADSSAMQCLMLLAPVFNRKHESCGSIELLQRSNISPAARDGYLKFLVRIAELFQRWHESHDLTRLSQNADQYSTTMTFVSEVHGSIDFKETAFAIANEARRLLNCDRASFAAWNGSSCKVIAVSGQDRFDNRANVIRKLGKLATSSVAGNVPLWLTGDTEGLPPEIIRHVNDYMDESHSRTLAVIPLLKKSKDQAELDFDPRRRKKPKKLGALIIEYFDDDVAQEKVLDSVQLVTQHSEIATANALEHKKIFLRPLWKRLGELSSFLFRDHFAKTMTALAALALFVLYLVIWPSELKMRVSGVIQPAERRNIFAKTEGVVETINVDQGDVVKKGEVLMELQNPDLDISIEETRGQLGIAEQRILEVKAQLSNINALPQQERQVLWGQKDQLTYQKANLEYRLGLMERKKSMQTIASPIGGTVVTWEAQKRLTDLPISQNQFIMSIADFEGAWQAELRVPQNQVGYVVAALNESDGEPLEVEFRLATNPNKLLMGKLVKLADRTDPGQSGVPEFRAIVDADISDLEDLRPGAGLTAKIYCGQHRTGFVWFYQLIDFLRTRVLF